MGSGGPFERPLRSSLVGLLTGSLRGVGAPGGGAGSGALRVGGLRVGGLRGSGLRGGSRSAIARILPPILDALQADALPAALRHLDRAWRAHPKDALSIAPLYARALMLEGGDPDATLSMAQAALDLTPDPDLAATRVLALLRLGRTGEARQHLEAALGGYCVTPAGTLACAADEVMRHPAIDAPGWIGLGPLLERVTRMARPDALADVEDHEDHGRRIAYCRGMSLLGSGAQTSADFGLDGRAMNRGRRLTAWTRLGWRPDQLPRLRVMDDRERSAELRTRGPPAAGWRWHFALDLDTTDLRGDRVQVLACLPDGRWQPLPDSPLLLQVPAPPPAPRRRSAPPAQGAAPARGPTLRTRSPQSPRLPSPVQRLPHPAPRCVEIIIPVYGNREEALACIDAARATVDAQTRLLVVDDAGTDPRLAAELDALARAGRITLLRNADNLGFAGAVNRGLAHDPGRDVVLLNSDTQVFGDWLERLRRAAYADAAVGTVTPLSNNGSIASYPRRSGSAAVTPEEAASLHALAAATNSGRSVDLPVGVGFCLYIRRDCLNAVGPLDAAVFGKGYGEETDFCLRARSAGWTHRLAADVYVSHAGAASFGTRRAALLDRSQRLLNLRHPGYDQDIERFQARDPVHEPRRRLDERRLLQQAGRRVLIVTLALSGGVDRFVKERCLQLHALGVTPLLLRPAAAGDSSRCELWADGLDLPNLQYRVPSELPALEAILGALGVEAIEIQHFLHLDPRVVEAVRRLPAPHDVFIHDYAWLCPRVTLIDGGGRYCGEPALRVCESCVKRHGSNLGESLSVQALRTRSANWLRGARRVIAPSHDTAARIRKHFAGLAVEVHPHASPPLFASTLRESSPAIAPSSVAPSTPRVVRIALLGAIGAHKGYDVLLQCARDARARRLPLEFVVIGYTENDAPLLATGTVFITGPYIDGEAPHLLARERPDVVWLPSVWPETWCYTLDYALAAEVPVAAFDLGAIAERLRAAPRSARAAPRRLLMPLTTPSQRINDGLLDFVNGPPVAALALTNSVKSLPARTRRTASIDELQLRGMSMIKSTNGRTAAEGADTGLSASVQVLPLAAGLYLFSVKSAKPAATGGGGQLTLPAMHVGLGPGVRSDQVEFMASPSTHGAWLFSATDQLVTRVNGAGATLVLTSVRAPTGDVLSIKVERLDARIDTTETSAVAAAAIAPAKMVAVAKPADAPLSVQIATHVRARGDLQFVDAPWAGRVAPGLWIESFAVLPLEHLGAHDIEYKALTGSGFETPWLSDNAACGTKGMGVPLVGFAMRLRPSTGAAGYDCEYSGYFQSGLTVGPLRNGAPCRSSVANDPLEGLQVRLVKRPAVGAGTKVAAATAPAAQQRPPKLASLPATGGIRKSAAAKAKVPQSAEPKMPPPAEARPGKRVALAR